MIDYETYSRILSLHNEGFSNSRIAKICGIDVQTVSSWLAKGKYSQRKASIRPSKLDPYKPYIRNLVEKYPYTGTQIFHRIKDAGYKGGITILKDYLTLIRPRKQEAYLTLSFSPGECAQVDWGQYGTIEIGSTKRKLSFFVMVLCYSRMMYLEFTLMEKMEHFLTCHKNAFEFFGAVPQSVMVDNLKCAVLKRPLGQPPVFNSRYLDFSQHYGFKIKACGVAKGNEKGRVENAVGYVKKNLLSGLAIPGLTTINIAGKEWVDTVANVRTHGTTRRQPVELFKTEKPAMLPLPVMPYDTASIFQARVNNRFRVVVDTNRYSTPAEYANSHVTVYAYPDRLCMYYNKKLIARHERSYDRYQDIENPDHPRELLKTKAKAREQRLMKTFLKISSKSEEYYKGLRTHKMNAKHHIRKIVALSEIYSAEKVCDAIDDAIHFKAYGSEYIANIIEQREKKIPQPQALHLTRKTDLLDTEMPEPDLSIYQKKDEDNQKDETNE